LIDCLIDDFGDLSEVSQNMIEDAIDWVRTLLSHADKKSKMLELIGLYITASRNAAARGFQGLSEALKDEILLYKEQVRSNGYWSLRGDSNEEPYTWIPSGVASGVIHDESDMDTCDCAIWAWNFGTLGMEDVEFIKTAILRGAGNWTEAFLKISKKIFRACGGNVMELPLAFCHYPVSRMVTPMGELVVRRIEGGVAVSCGDTTVSERWDSDGNIEIQFPLFGSHELTIRLHRIVPDEEILCQAMMSSLSKVIDGKADASAVMSEVTALMAPGSITFEAAKSDPCVMRMMIVVRDYIEAVGADASIIDSNMEKGGFVVPDDADDLDLENLYGKPGWWTR
jgi:hypothetical protein